MGARGGKRKMATKSRLYKTAFALRVELGIGAGRVGGGAMRLEAFYHPGVGTTASFPEGDVAAVGRGNGPTDVPVGILKYLAHTTAKIDVEQRLGARKGRRAGPHTLTVGSPIQAGNAAVALQLERPRFPRFRGKELDFGAAPLGKGNRLSVGRKTPVVFGSLDANSERRLTAGGRVELDELNVLGCGLSNDAQRGRQSGALKIVDGFALQDELRSAA